MLVSKLFDSLIQPVPIYITQILLVGSYAVDIGQLQYENVDVNAGQVGRHWQESWQNKKNDWNESGSVPLTTGSVFRSCSFR